MAWAAAMSVPAATSALGSLPPALVVDLASAVVSAAAAVGRLAEAVGALSGRDLLGGPAFGFRCRCLLKSKAAL